MRSSRGLIRLSLVVAVVVLVLGCGSASAAWTIRSTTVPTGTTSSSLYGVSCASEKACWAVGEYRNSSGVLEPLAEEPIAGTYGLPPTPGSTPVLWDVSCPLSSSSGFCMAVGKFINGSGSIQAFAEKYTTLGGWQLQTLTFPAGNTASELGSISCATESECVAVGDYHNATGEHYLAERWTSGGGWAPETPAEPAGAGFPGLTAISCPVTGGCVAVGAYRVSPYHPANQTMETELFSSSASPHWSYQGGTMAEPFGPSLGTVPFISTDSCTAMTECSGVGYYQNASNERRMQAWKKIAAGPGWEEQTLPTLTGESELHGVSCSTITAYCVAVGRQAALGGGKAIAFEPSGATWAQITLPTVTGSTDSLLNRDSCILKATFCYAVGYKVVSGATSLLVERNF
jgi:hypothetical protein